jgi:Flp pilus assembly protein TadG
MSLRGNDQGAVTAELAIVLPVLFTLLLLGAWTIGLMTTNLRCTDAARDVARATARGDPPAQAKSQANLPNATITITHEAGYIHVTVTATPTQTPPLLSFLTPPHLTATATLQAEPATLQAEPAGLP